MKIQKLQYLFDPLCGWCYASAPALLHLSTHYCDTLELLPSGLFSGHNRLSIGHKWTEMAWENDRRIASLTGQVFSESYKYLINQQVELDSTFLTRALTVFNEIDPTSEAGLLHKFQVSRYVDGIDTSKSDAVAQLAVSYAMETGLGLLNSDFDEQLRSDEELIELTEARIKSVSTLMQSQKISGVPILLIITDEKTYSVSGAALYGGVETIEKVLDRIISPY